ncbi:hypothetical protein QFZ99_004659 [Paraburkholderia atlantica]
MLRCSYPVTAVDAWSTILRALRQLNLTRALPKESGMKQSGNAWTFETTIDGPSDNEELFVYVALSEEAHITVRRA